MDALDLASLHTFPVVHCRHSYGLSVQGNAGWKVVFSGDTRPCAAVEEAAQGATLLVHEATFEDGLEDEAVTKRHSTVSDAVATGTKVGGHPKPPLFNTSNPVSTPPMTHTGWVLPHNPDPL